MTEAERNETFATVIGERDDDVTLAAVASLKDEFNRIMQDNEQLRNRGGGDVPNGFTTWAEAYGDAQRQISEAKQRYIDRFLSGGGQHQDPIEDEKPLTYENLFKRG